MGGRPSEPIPLDILSGSPFLRTRTPPGCGRAHIERIVCIPSIPRLCPPFSLELANPLVSGSSSMPSSPFPSAPETHPRAEAAAPRDVEFVWSDWLLPVPEIFGRRIDVFQDWSLIALSPPRPPIPSCLSPLLFAGRPLVYNGGGGCAGWRSRS